MNPKQENLNVIKIILGSIANPDELDDHPWIKSLVVQEMYKTYPEMRDKAPGYILLFSFYVLFCEMMPNSPPVRGKRNHTKWRQFGILAAKYFMPLIYGSVSPNSLEDAWLKINESIQFLISNQNNGYFNSQDSDFNFIDNSDGIPPASTLSTWHIRGLESLINIFLDREKYLSNQTGNPSVVINTSNLAAGQKKPFKYILFIPRQVRLAVLLFLFIGIGLTGNKIWRLGQIGNKLYADIQETINIIAAPQDLGEIETFGSLISMIRQDMAVLQEEMGSLVNYCPMLGWIPKYGSDLVMCGELIDYGVYLSIAADETFQGSKPLILTFQAGENIFTSSDLRESLELGQSHLDLAFAALSQAEGVRASIRENELSADMQKIFIKTDEYLPLWADALVATKSLPDLMRAVNQLLLTPHTFEEIDMHGSLISSIRHELVILRGEVETLVNYCPLLAWIPKYGNELAVCGEYLEYWTYLAIAADEAYQGGQPFFNAFQAKDIKPALPDILKLLEKNKYKFAVAEESLSRAKEVRPSIDKQESLEDKKNIFAKVDPYMPLLEDGLDIAAILPKLLGATVDGPQTYLLLFQNEDELRATGGFITAVGSITIENGRVLSLIVENSPDVDNLELPYNLLPWQMVEYMNGGLWLLRDVNWSPDFPVVAEYAEHLYSYSRSQKVDGVIAIDQEAIRMIVESTGPLEVNGQEVTANNVIEFMRSEKTRYGEINPASYKDFIPVLASAIITRVQDGSIESSWEALIKTIINGLNEKHILIQVDDPVLSNLLASRKWDGALLQGNGDFLMVVDSNLGYNKVNAVVERQLVYTVDVSNLASPRSELLVFHENRSTKDIECVQRQYLDGKDYDNLIDQCYWNYFRVYTQEDTLLLDATPHAVPDSQMISGNPVPARVDILGMFDGGYGFGTMMVIPTNSSLKTVFKLGLPTSVLKIGDGINLATYSLRIQKQPGTRNIPLALKIRLPEGAEINTVSASGSWRGEFWVSRLSINQDIEFVLTFRFP